MLGTYLPIAVMMVLAAVIAIGMVAASFLLGPKRPTRFKQAAYECGMTPVGTARQRFPVKFYLVAMLFIIFDIETVFLYPWAVIFRGTGRDYADKVYLLVEMAVFVVILFVGYFYILGKGALDWDEAAEGVLEPSARVLERRPPIRFGNEGAPVRLDGAKATAHEPKERTAA